MFSKIFDIDYPKLVSLLTPPDLRKQRLLALLGALIMPVRTVYGSFKANRISNLYKLAHNGQICYLRKALNDSFDPVLRRIYIGDGSRFKRQYIYTSGEQQARYLRTIYIQPTTEYEDTGVDFKVIVPVGFDLAGNLYQLRALIDFYKLAGKRYTIEIA